MTSDQLDLFDGTDLLHGPPVMVTGICHWCQAQTEPIPLTESGDPGAPWTGVSVWASVTLMGHFRVCPSAVQGRTQLPIVARPT